MSSDCDRCGGDGHWFHVHEDGSFGCMHTCFQCDSVSPMLKGDMSDDKVDDIRRKHFGVSDDGAGQTANQIVEGLRCCRSARWRVEYNEANALPYVARFCEEHGLACEQVDKQKLREVDEYIRMTSFAGKPDSEGKTVAKQGGEENPHAWAEPLVDVLTDFADEVNRVTDETVDTVDVYASGIV